MKTHYKDIKKIMRMKRRSLNFTKSATRRIGRFYSLKYYPNQMNPSMIQARKNRSLKKSNGKKTTTKAVKKLKRPHSLKKHQKLLSSLVQTQMTQTMNKNL